MATKNTYMTAAKLALLIAFLPKNEVNKHFTLKTGDKGPNNTHCRAVCDLLVKAHDKHKDALGKLAARFGYTIPQLAMAGTGRPLKSRTSGLKTGSQFHADRVANQVLTELAKLAGVKRPDCRYNNSSQGLVAMPAKVGEAMKEVAFAPAATPAPATKPAKPAAPATAATDKQAANK